MSVRIAPSILGADFARLGEAVASVEEAGADLIHVDVMDGHFVPNISIGVPVVAALKRVARVPLDVHLMVQHPGRYLDAFIDAGAAMVTVHVEVLPEVGPTLDAIRRRGAKAGVALNPSTPVEAVGPLIHELDHLLIMSVNPGFAGQPFIPGTFDKIARARGLLAASGSRVAIEVDGGVDLGNAAALVRAGATILVAAKAIFGKGDIAEATRALRRAAEAPV